ncbi:MAG: shikimate dehydrogenase [Acidobacteriota bacterium]|nr:MAG: shikimate dehydrogenase [Acidobacteriota bacterium]
MGAGLVCISVTDSTSERFLLKASKACANAAAVELRFDSLSPDELPKVVEGLAEIRRDYGGVLIGTLRSSAEGQGGLRDVSTEEIASFWSDPRLRNAVDWVDAGPDELPDPPSEYKRIIRSRHYFDSAPTEAELAEVASVLKNCGSDPSRNAIKIACTPDDITGAIPVWNLLEHNDEKIAIAMGKFGVWTRILAPAYGSAVTYASIDDGPESAPGQIRFEELTETYRVGEITEETSVYGIVGLPVSHSLSPAIHNASFRERAIDAVYVPLAVRDAGEFFREMVSPATRKIKWNLRGFSVTHPHKTSMARLVERLTADAEAIGAVNTVMIESGTCVGSNTDAEGFLASLKTKLGDPKGASVGIIGSGGAARAAVFALSNAGARTVIFSRDPSKAKGISDRFGTKIRLLQRDPASFQGLDVIVNASPIGSSGGLEGESPVPREALENLQLAFDMVYNPIRTRFLRDASDAGIPTIGGLEMLIEQAALQFRTWTGQEAPKDAMLRTAESRMRSL